MASRVKSRSSGKSQSPTPSPGSHGHGRKSARGKDMKNRGSEDEKERLAFKVLSADHTKTLSEISDVDQLQEKLAEVLQITNHCTDLKEGSSLDYFVAGFWWTKEQNFNQEQASALFTIIHILLDNIKEKQLSLTDNLKEFKKMFAGIGIEPNPEVPVKIQSGGLDGVFNVTQAKAITDYVHRSFFQHYKLFEFMFCHTQAEEIIGTDLLVEVPLPASLPWPPPLEEGVPEELHQQYIATPPPTPQPEEGAEVAVDGAGQAESAEDLAANAEREADILAQLTAEEIQDIMDSVFTEMLGGVETEIVAKLRDKENAYINRINKIHKVAD